MTPVCPYSITKLSQASFKSTNDELNKQVTNVSLSKEWKINITAFNFPSGKLYKPKGSKRVV